jgi:3-deoxy-D-manno-octulosonic-acid transferase
MMFILFFIGYQILQLLALPGLVVFFIGRIYKGKQIFGNLAQRFGVVPRNIDRPSIWVHAVSVGETLATEYFIHDLAVSGQNIYLTSGTVGAIQVSKNFSVNYRSYLPLDFLPCILIAFWRIKPKALIIIEGDWWPNLIMVAKLFRIPVYGLNARVTKHTGWRKLIFKITCYGVLRNIKQLFAQSATHAQAFIDNGISIDAVQTLGNMKAYNVWAKHKALNFVTKTPLHQVIMAGSIHPGEAAIFFNCYASLKKQFRNLKLIIVPRHLHWLEQCTTMAKEIGKTYVLSVKPNIAFTTTVGDYDIIIGGALGIMFELYPYASLFQLGGTFVPIGGHNLLEPAAWGIASIVGPNHHACRQTLQELEKISAGSVALDGKALLEQSAKYLVDPASLAAAGIRAALWLQVDAIACREALQKFATTLHSL